MTQERLNQQLVIVGFGNQAKSWALNLNDSGFDIQILLRKQSPSLVLARKLGFSTLTFHDELEGMDNFVILTPDHTHSEILDQLYEKVGQRKVRIIYAHGYSLTTHKLQEKFPQWSHLLLAPKAIASEVRFQYETQGKLGAVYSVEFSPSPKEDQTYLQSLASGLGITSGPYPSSFKKESHADLFSEQGILCSILPYAANLCYKKLREKGVDKELAYFECWYEVKLIADTLIKVGPEKFFDMISPNALYGSQKGAKALLDENFQERLTELLDDVYSGKYYQELEGMDYSKLKQEVSEFWSAQELSQTHQVLEKELFS